MENKQNVLITKVQHQLSSPPGYYTLPFYESAVEFLRNTSGSIKQLQFHGDSFVDDEKEDISRAIAEYCGNSLIELILQEAGTFLITNQSKRFSKVRSLRIHYEYLPDNIQINRIYPALENLSIYVGSRLLRRNPIITRIQQILPTVPQLRHLTIDGVANTILPSIHANLMHLKSLSIKYDGDEYLDEPLHFSDIRKFQIHVIRSAFTDSHPVPFTFDRLEVLELNGSVNDDYTMGWLQQNVHLKELITDVHVNEIAATSINSLPNLEHITLNANAEKSLAIILDRLHRVKKVTFTITQNYSFDQQRLIRTLPKGWKMADGWKEDNNSDRITLTVHRTRTWGRLKSGVEKWF